MIARTPIKHVVVAKTGDLFGFPKRSLVNYVAGKNTPTYSLPGSIWFRRALAEGARMPFVKPTVGRDDVAVLQYTGGTTGLSKGATLTHGALLSAVLASEAWVQPALKRRKMTGQATFVCALPLYQRVRLHLVRAPGDADRRPQCAGSQPARHGRHDQGSREVQDSLFPAVNTLFNGLANHADIDKLNFSELMVSNGGAAPPCRRRWRGNGSKPRVVRSWKGMGSPRPARV